MAFISYAQNFEDVILYRALKEADKGFYVDVGAWDPVMDSVTKAFYDRGWRGINIEPSRPYYEKLAKERQRDINLMVVAGKTKGLVKFYEILETGLSTTDKAAADHFANQGYTVREYQVPCLPLADICDANQVKEIHFLKIDVEGMEEEVVEGCDFTRFRPWIVVIEAIDPVTQRPVNPVWERILFEHNYQFVYYDGLNRFYLAREKSALKTAFDSPPCIFDGFVRCSEAKAVQENQQLKEAIGTFDTERQALRAQIEKLSSKRSELEKETLREKLGELKRQNEQFRQRVKENEARLTELTKVLSALQGEKEILRTELAASAEQRDKLQKQVTELHRWLQAVYASTSWRITAPLRLTKMAMVGVIKGIRRAPAKLMHWAFRVALREVSKLARWAARDPRLRSLGTRLLSKSPRLKSRVRCLLTPQASPELAPATQERRTPEALSHLPASAQRVYWELKEEIERVASGGGHENRR